MHEANRLIATERDAHQNGHKKQGPEALQPINATPTSLVNRASHRRLIHRKLLTMGHLVSCE